MILTLSNIISGQKFARYAVHCAKKKTTTKKTFCTIDQILTPFSTHALNRNNHLHSKAGKLPVRYLVMEDHTTSSSIPSCISIQNTHNVECFFLQQGPLRKPPVSHLHGQQP